MKRRGTSDAGFTLVELLIAMSLLGLVMTTVVALFSSGMRLREVTRERMAFESDARLFVGSLGDDLANLVPSGPAPMITADSIVLWRLRHGTGAEDEAAAELVTYQWSGSATQDSQLVRLAAPLALDAADYETVRRTFMQWARTFDPSPISVRHLIREDGGTRFGSRATLNELSGAWTAYPHIRSFACGITADPDEYHGGNARSRILVKLSETPWDDLPVPDPLLRLALIPDDGSLVEAGFWLPVAAQIPIRPADDPLEEVLP